jgi:hypothetical protein
MERKKKIKYDLSYFTLDGGATGSKRARGKGKSGKHKVKHKGKTSKSFDESPEDPDPNSGNNRRNFEDLRNGLAVFSSKEQRKFQSHSAVYPKFLMPKINDPDEMM